MSHLPPPEHMGPWAHGTPVPTGAISKLGALWLGGAGGETVSLLVPGAPWVGLVLDVVLSVSAVCSA